MCLSFFIHEHWEVLPVSMVDHWPCFWCRDRRSLGLHRCRRLLLLLQRQGQKSEDRGRDCATPQSKATRRPQQNGIEGHREVSSMATPSIINQCIHFQISTKKASLLSPVSESALDLTFTSFGHYLDNRHTIGDKKITR